MDITGKRRLGNRGRGSSNSNTTFGIGGGLVTKLKDRGGEVGGKKITARANWQRKGGSV